MDKTMNTPKAPKPISPYQNRSFALRALTVAIIATLAAIIGLGLGGFAWYHWSHLKHHVLTKQHKLTSDLQKHQLQSDVQFKLLQDHLNHEHKRLGVAQTRLSHVLNIHHQAARQRLLSHVAYLLNLADLQLRINHNRDAGLKLLNEAATRLDKTSDVTLLPLKQAIKQDTHALHQTKHFNLDHLILQLDQINQSIQSLKLLGSKIKQQHTQTHHSDHQQNKHKTTWYQRLWDNTKHLKDLVVIRHRDQSLKPLLSPETAALLKASIQAKLMQAQWAAIHHQQALYQHSMTQALDLLNHFQHQQHALVTIKKQLQALAKINIAPKLPSIQNALNALNNSLYIDIKKNRTRKPQASAPNQKHKTIKSQPEKIPSKTRAKPTTPQIPKTPRTINPGIAI